jgi:radical SAM superfamily enzyme YgiQ (UPF0313 family)
VEILLAYKSHARGATDPFTSLLPVGLGYINALLREAGHRSKVTNFSRYSWRAIRGLITAAPPGILGVSQFTHNRYDSLKLAKLVKEINPSCFVVFGGPHATHRFREILALYDAVDAVVLGEGEQTFLELASLAVGGRMDALGSVRGLALRRAGDVVKTPPREPWSDLDGLPFPSCCLGDAVGVDLHRQLEFIITSRGCPASCRFCASPRFWGTAVRFRSPRSIIDEIRSIKDRYGLIYFSIRDDTFTADRERVLEFCRLVHEEKLYILWNCQSRVNAVDEEVLFAMKRAGCECVQFGVESGSVRVLRVLGKGITLEQVRKAAALTRRAGINLSLYLMTGVPGETDADVQETISLLDSVRPNDGQVSPLAWYPGAALFERGVATGEIDRALFESDESEALYARSDPFVARSVRKLLRHLELVAEKCQFSPADFQAQKDVLGYCHATSIMAGEMYEDSSQWRKAEAEYREVTAREPENPWGWLMIGELYARLGESARSRDAFETLARLVPAHAPAFASLGELSRLEGDYATARDYYQKALVLDPGDRVSGEGIRLIGT